MKRIIAIAVALMMLCGFAFAEESVVDAISSCLETEFTYTGTESILNALAGSGEDIVLNNSLTAFVFPTGGYILEYTDKNGERYHWSNFELSYTDAGIDMCNIIASCYATNCIESGFFLVVDGDECVVIGDYYQTDYEVFIEECLMVLISSLLS